jgi:hypothetical protein
MADRARMLHGRIGSSGGNYASVDFAIYVSCFMRLHLAFSFFLRNCKNVG